MLKSRTKTTVAVIVVAVASFAATTGIVVAASASPGDDAPVATETAKAAEPTEPVEELRIGDVTEVRSAADITLPIDEYRMTSQEENLVLRAEHKAMVSCMDRFGAAFDVAVQTVSADNRNYDRLFGVLNQDEVQQYGYHAPGDVILGSGESTGSKDDSGVLDENALAIATGENSSAVDSDGHAVPLGGCITEARTQTGDDGSGQELQESLIGYSLQQSDLDPRVLKAFDAWSACMKDRGLSYSTPMDAINDRRWSTTSATGDEIETATADVECKLATNLTGLRVAVAAAWQTDYIASHPKEFNALKERNAAIVEKSRAVLSSGG